jgi:hypothetical protein
MPCLRDHTAHSFSEKSSCNKGVSSRICNDAAPEWRSASVPKAILRNVAFSIDTAAYKHAKKSCDNLHQLNDDILVP